MRQKIDNSHLAAFSVGYPTRPEFKLRANSSSPLKWTEILVQLAFSPLERTFSMSLRINSQAGEWVGAR